MQKNTPKKQREVVSVKKAIEILGMTRSVFYVNHQKNFTKLPKVKRNVFLDYKEVMALKERLDNGTNYKVIG